MGGVRFSDRELDVMSVLWRRGSGTVSEVQEALADELAYTTVLTFLQKLEEKGHVRHEQEGRAYRYYPTVAPEEAGESALKRVLEKIYHGSAEGLLAQLVSDRDLSAGELDRMRRMLARHRRRVVEEGAERTAKGPDPWDEAAGPNGEDKR